MSDKEKKSGKDEYVSDAPVYHENVRYAPGTPLPAAAVKALHPDLVRKATKADLKAVEEAEQTEPEANPDAEEDGA
jgi:hypothetical protein